MPTVTSSAMTANETRRILVVDDHEPMRKVVAKTLEREGFAVVQAGTARDAVEAVGAGHFDLVVLDLRLPDADGLDVLALLRDGRDTPTVILSGRATEGDRILGLVSGADDYVTKPFSPRELVARVQAVLRRADRHRIAERLAFGDLEIDVAAREVRLAGRPVALTPQEFDLLGALASRAGRACSREDLLLWAWGHSPDGIGVATVTEHVRRLRSKLEDDPERPRRIVTVRGVGYRFDP